MKLALVRLLTALVFATGAVLAFRHFHHASFATLVLVLFLYLCALMVTIAFLLDYPRLPRQPRVSEAADELERLNLLVTAAFTADRAFRVREFDEEGPHYLLELEDGSVLHLSGTYLLDYEPGPQAPRHFPCTRFTVRRHAELGHVVDILCSGLIIEPEVDAPPFTHRDFTRGLVPRDGEILRTLTFDQLRQQRLGSKYHIH